MRLVLTALGTLLLSLGVSSSQATSAANVPSFYKDVLPILQKNCQSCHRPEQIAPMSLLDYEQTRPYARAIKAAVASKRMPPWYADPGIGHFANDRSLSQGAIEVLTAWVDAGAPAGNPQDAPATVRWPEGGWTVKPDRVIDIPPYTVPPKGTVEWLDMTIPNPFKDDTWLRSIELLPSKASLVHHACIFFVRHSEKTKYNEWSWRDIPRDADGAAIQSRQAALALTRPVNDGTQGLEYCYEPSYTIDDYQKYDAAKLLYANMDLRISIHYTPNGSEFTDHSKIGLVVAQTPPSRRLLSIAPSSPSDPTLFAIPPNDPNWQSPPVDLTFNYDAEIVWLSPHMHYRGKDMSYTLTYPDGRQETILRVSRYDYKWQVGYDTSVKVPKGTKLHVDAHYDNSTANKYNPNPNKTVYYGNQTWEEMMAPFFNIVVAKDVELKGVVTGSRFANGA